MLSMSCDHPDIEEFIDIKKDLNRVTKANISVRITDSFMNAVVENQNYDLIFRREETGEEIHKTINARKLMEKLAYNNWEMGEPGMLFWDRISNYNMLNTYENFEYASVNPCAEEPLPAGGSCLLGSINLAAFVKIDNQNKPYFDFQRLKKVTKIAVKGLNDVLDEGLPLHPLKEQRENVRDWRQIGLGIFGLADALIKLKIRYGSEESLGLSDAIGHTMACAALKASSSYGVSFPKFEKEKSLNSNFIQAHNFDGDTLYNSQLLTIAPTGSIATMLGVSGGIEPIFANYYTRKTESLHGKDTYYKIYTPIVEKYMTEHGLEDDKELPDYFVTAGDIDYHNRIDMQSIWQKHIDASISSTVNLPEQTTQEQILDLYIYAWKKQLKGITIFRNNCKRAGILTLDSEKEKKKNDFAFDSIIPVSRKTLGTTHGNTYCRRCACGTLYITVNSDDQGNLVETFVESSKGGVCKANTAAVNRMISLAMRSGVKIEEIIDQLKGIDCQACTRVKANGKNIDGKSCPDIIASVIADYYKYVKAEKEPCALNAAALPQNEATVCPECGSAIRNEGGCVVCPSCGWSRCG